MNGSTPPAAVSPLRPPGRIGRRGFVSRVAGAALMAAGPAGGDTALGATRVPAPRGRAPLFKISLAQWSLHRTLFEKRLDNLDFAATANGLGFDAVEYVNQFFKERARDRAYLAEMKRRAQGEGIWSALVMVDRAGALGTADPKKRREAVEAHRAWVEAAAYLGCHSIRVNAHGDGPPEEHAKQVAEALRELAEIGDPLGVNVIVENHGGISSDARWLAGVIRAVDHPRCGTLPDFGNFKLRDGEEYDRYQGVKELMPLAKAVSAKSHGFDKAGNETGIDYVRMMTIVCDAGYRGYVGVEYEGTTHPEVEGIRLTKRLLERVRARLEAAPAR